MNLIKSDDLRYWAGSNAMKKLLAVAGILAFGIVSSQLSFGPQIVFYGLTFFFAFLLSPYSYQKTFSLVVPALALRLVLSLCLPYVVKFDDEIGYRRMAEDVVNSLHAGLQNPWCYNPWGNVTAIVFYFFGISESAIKAFNALLGVTTAFLLCRSAEKLYDNPRLTELTLKLALFLPPIAFLSSVALKEQMIAFLLVAMLYGVTRYSLWGWLIGLASCGLLIPFRPNLILVILPLLGIYWALRIGLRSNTSKAFQRLIAAGALGLVVMGGVFVAQHESLQNLEAYMILSGSDTRGHDVMAESEATFNKYLDTDDPLSPKNLILVPIRAIYTPSPLRPIKTFSPPILLESVMLTALLCLALPFVFIAIWRSRKNPDQMLAAGLFLVVFLTAAFSTLTYAPEAFRYRWADFPIYFMLAAYGWQFRHEPWCRNLIRGWYGSVLVFNAIYLM
jgi:hypothetical protein